MEPDDHRPRRGTRAAVWAGAGASLGNLRVQAQLVEDPALDSPPRLSAHGTQEAVRAATGITSLGETDAVLARPREPQRRAIDEKVTDAKLEVAEQARPLFGGRPRS